MVCWPHTWDPKILQAKRSQDSQGPAPPWAVNVVVAKVSQLERLPSRRLLLASQAEAVRKLFKIFLISWPVNLINQVVSSIENHKVLFGCYPFAIQEAKFSTLKSHLESSHPRRGGTWGAILWGDGWNLHYSKTWIFRAFIGVISPHFTSFITATGPIVLSSLLDSFLQLQKPQLRAFWGDSITKPPCLVGGWTNPASQIGSSTCG